MEACGADRWLDVIRSDKRHRGLLCSGVMVGDRGLDTRDAVSSAVGQSGIIFWPVGDLQFGAKGESVVSCDGAGGQLLVSPANCLFDWWVDRDPVQTGSFCRGSRRKGVNCGRKVDKPPN